MLPLVNNISFYFLRKKLKNLSIKGLINRHEAKFLYLSALINPKSGRIVEIGSHFGYSTIFLAKACSQVNGGKVFAIDPHTGNPEHREIDRNFNSFTEFTKNLKLTGLSNWVEPIVKPSSEAISLWKNEPIRMLWIDGNHEYHYVKTDYELWSPFLIKGGIIAFHDATDYSPWEGPKQIVKEIVKTGLYSSFNTVRHGIAWATKL